MPHLKRAHLHAAAAVCPGFIPLDLYPNPGGMVLITGTTPAGPALAKFPADENDDHVVRLRREIAAYTLLAETCAPVPVPRLLGADPALGVLVLERIDGRALVEARRGDARSVEVQIDALLAALATLASWHGPRAGLGVESDYVRDLTVAGGLGLVSAGEARIVGALLEDVGEHSCYSHGAVWGTHLLVQPDGSPVLIGWGRAGMRLPGADYASAWCALAAVPATRERIEQAVAASSPQIRAGFAAARSLEVARIILQVLQKPAGSAREAALENLSKDARASRRDLYALA
jgi:hypothetical protein